MTAPLLTVAITNYNYGRYLDRAIESVLAQTFGDFEILIIDNASSDDSIAVADRHAGRDARIRVVAHERNLGIFASFRESCDLARGRYKLHLDADDWVIAPDALALQVELLEAHPELAFAYSAMTMITPEGRGVYTSHPYSDNRVQSGAEALEAVLGFNLAHSGMMIRLDSYRASAGYPDRFAHIADMVLGARLCEVGGVGYIDRELYAIRQHGENLHLRPEPGVIRDEILPAVTEALAGPLGRQVPREVHQRVIRNALLHLPTQYIFNGHLRTGWALYRQALWLRPADMLLARRTVNLAARTLLGHGLYNRLRGSRAATPATTPSAAAEWWAATPVEATPTREGPAR